MFLDSGSGYDLGTLTNLMPMLVRGSGKWGRLPACGWQLCIETGKHFKPKASVGRMLAIECRKPRK